MDTVKKGDISSLGKSYEIKIDRPVGAEHPKHAGLIYPINYGYVEGLLAGDGEEQDVYVLGSSEPVSEYSGVIVAVINRSNDNEDKWVMVSEDYLDGDTMDKPLLYEPYIRAAVDFQEQYYHSEVTCLYEKTCGTVCFTVEDGEVKYLLVQNKDSGHIGYPKGHIELNETETETAIREVKEETGLDVMPWDGFRFEYSFTLPNGIRKNCVYFVGEYKSGAYTIQEEELGASWVLNFDDAMAKLNYPQDKAVLEAANAEIMKRRRS